MDKEKEKTIKAPVHEEAEEREKKRRSEFMVHLDIALWCFLVLAASILFFFILQKTPFILRTIRKILSILAPVIVGFALAYVLGPVEGWLEERFMKLYSGRKKKNGDSRKGKKQKEKKDSGEIKDDANPFLVDGRGGARALAIFITITASVALLTLLLMAVIPALIDSVSTLAQRLPEYIDQITNTANHIIDKHEWIKKQIPDADEVMERLNIYDRLEGVLNTFLSKAADWVIVAFKIVYNVVIGLIVAIYLLAGRERYVGQLKKLSFAVMKPRHAKHFIQNMHGTNIIFKSSILGKILDSFIIGLICYIAMAIMGMCGLEAIGDNKVLISIVIGVTNVVPFFGPFFGGIPSVFLIMCVNFWEGVIMGILIIVLQQFDSNYLTPMIVGKSVGLSPFYVLVAILLGGGLFGVIGMLVAVPVGAVIYGFIKSAVETKLEEKKLPVKTNEYAMTPGAVIFEKMKED